jgi:hypothetical protein
MEKKNKRIKDQRKSFKKNTEMIEDPFSISPVKPTSFYSNEREKIKLNWFCYELAIGIYDELSKNFSQRLKRYNIDEKEMVEFSIYISRTMKEIILQKLSNKIEKAYFSYEMVEACYSQLDDELVNKILEAISKVWDEQLKICEICPTRCISEKDAYCTMFDEGPY